MKQNHGFTLIELIVVMVILGILAIGSVAGFNLLRGGSAKRASEQVITMMDYIQMENLTKTKNYFIQIDKDPVSGEHRLKVITEEAGVAEIESTELLKLQNGQVTYEDSLGGTYSVGTATALRLSFRKDTGGVKTDAVTGAAVTRIGITSEGTTYYIRLVTATGKHFIE